MTLRTTPAILMLLLTSAGCSTAEKGINKVPDSLAEDLPEEAVGNDFATHAETAPPETLEPEVLLDAGGESIFVECEPGEGCFLDGCVENADCQSGWCVEHMGDGVCSTVCQEDCPHGWSCKQVGLTGPDVAYICVSNYANLCRPCATGADCKTAVAEDVCVQYGEGENFCGGGCASEAREGEGCPWGFSCLEVETVDGILTSQCISDTGSCPCAGTSVEQALWTPCTIDNEFGVCEGKRVCTEDGLSECDAGVPAAEACNGIDDDCDGDVDEPTEVGGDYINLCNDDNPCTKDVCEGEAGCSHKDLSGVECIDGDSCTVGDHCDHGVCSGTPIACDDDNPCTDDSCDGVGGCFFNPNTLPCDDGDPCTAGDHCAVGECHGVEISCDCQFDEDCALLEDGDACNGTLFCDTEYLPYQCAVKPETIVVCPEPEEGPDTLCLKAVCDPATGDCSHDPDHDGYSCEDGDACTVGDTCTAGTCAPGVPLTCLDNNPCTDDSCDSETGCVFYTNTIPCDDGNTCTTGDTCAEGACVAQSVMPCDDNNPCTTDACDPLAGCTHTPNSAPCTDGDGCTVGDSCAAGQCVSGPPANCEDLNPCTDDSCDPQAGCLHEANAAACDDGNACTTGDHCAAGACIFDDVVSCQDDDKCTDNSCDPALGCVTTLNESPCDDGDVCTTGDHCHLGGCISAGELACNDGNPCTDDSCDPAAGCVFAPNTIPCDDGNACTTGETCADGACMAAEMIGCDDGNPCTDDVCDLAAGCIYYTNTLPCDDGDACTEDDACSQGECEPGEPLECDDDNVCTDDSCHQLLGCVFTPNTIPCDDANACTTGDVCAGGGCAGADPVICNDNNVCTDDSCNPATGCLFTPNTIPCNDEDACTTEDVCGGGSCQGSGELECNVEDYCAINGCVAVCHVASCDPDDGCVFAVVTPCCGNNITEAPEQCDDGNLADNDGCSSGCESEQPPGHYYILTGNPNPQSVFDQIVVTFRYPNNLTNGIWHGPSNLILVGEFNQSGYWKHPSNQGGYPNNPNNGSGRYGRMVQMPANQLVAYTTSPSSDGMGPAYPADLRLATIDENGNLGPPMNAQFSDGYNGTCNILSSSATEFFVYDGSTTIRKYDTTPGSGLLTHAGNITMSKGLAPNGTCNGGGCYGGTFAWDGKYFYFAQSQKGSGDLNYWVYSPGGQFQANYSAAGGGGMNGTYFDWSVGRYAIHDGYGNRQGGAIYSAVSSGSDSQCYGPVSSAHTLNSQ